MKTEYDPGSRIEEIEDLEALYGEASTRSLVKELDRLSEHYAQFVRNAPFVLVGSSGPKGLDQSPRGDQRGFVRVVDAKTLMIPDRRGNNRLDTLRNLVLDPRISLLFMIPGVGETMRVSGTASIVTDAELCDSFAVQGKSPQSVIVVHIEKAYFQCQKALVRSKLWDPDSHIERTDLPSVGQMSEALSNGEIDGASYDAEYPERMKQTLY